MTQVAAAYKIFQDALARGEAPVWSDCLAQAAEPAQQPAQAAQQAVPVTDPRIQQIEAELNALEHPPQ